MVNPLTYTIPDAPVIDAFRGFVIVAGALLFLGAPIAWWRMRHVVPTRIRGLLVVLLGADGYISATEAQQYGLPMLVWRLPLGFVVIVGALVYLARLSLAVAGDDPVK